MKYKRARVSLDGNGGSPGRGPIPELILRPYRVREERRYNTTDLKVIYKNARYAVLEIEDGGTYEAGRMYRIYLNGEFIREIGKAVTSIYNLRLDTGHQVEARSGDSLVSKASFTTNSEYVILDVRDFGAKGDGVQDDALFIQAAIVVCPEGSRVLIPIGTCRIVSLFLKDNVNTELAGEAVLSTYTDRIRFPVFQGMTQSYDGRGEYNLGTWEGNPLPMSISIITGVNVKEAVIHGQGIVGGNTGTGEGSWWHKPKVIHTVCRPKMIFLERCRQVMVQGITVRNSSSWNIYPYFSDHLRFFDLRVLSPKGSPNTDGLNPGSCKDVEIADICFSVGDDYIAVRSGKIYMGSTYKCPSRDISIRGYCMWDGHGSVIIGSEMMGGIRNLTIEDRMFLHTDRGLRIKTRRGRGKDVVVDRIVFEHVHMDHVMTPFVISCFYFCNPNGHSEYVRTEETLPVGDKTPFIKSLCFRDIEAENYHVTVAYMYDLPEQRIGRVEMERVRVSCATSAKEGQPAMIDDRDSHICRMGICANQIEELVLKDVKVEGQNGLAIITEDIGRVYGSI